MSGSGYREEREGEEMLVSTFPFAVRFELELGWMGDLDRSEVG